MKFPLALPLDSCSPRTIRITRPYEGSAHVTIEILTPEEDAALQAWIDGQSRVAPGPADVRGS